MFGDVQPKEKKISPISRFYDWKNYKEAIDSKKYLDGKLKTTTDQTEIDKITKEINELKLYNFETWDKENEKIVGHLPTQFILLSQTSCLKGWDVQHKGKIFSNEVISLRDEVIKAQSFTKGSKQINDIWEGNYTKEASAELKELGCKFTRGLIVLEGTDVCEYYLQGGILKQYSEDIALIDTQKYKVKLDRVEQQTNGSVTFYVPRWVQGDEITEEEASVAIEMVKFIKEYRSDE